MMKSQSQIVLLHFRCVATRTDGGSVDGHTGDIALLLQLMIPLSYCSSRNSLHPNHLRKFKYSTEHLRLKSSEIAGGLIHCGG